MISPLNSFKNFFKADAEYSHKSRDKILAANRQMLQIGCIIYFFVLAGYTIMTYIIGGFSQMMRLYIFFDIFHIAFTLVVMLHPKKTKRSFRATQVMCSVFEISILSFFAVEGIIYDLNSHSLYIPIAILLVILLFDHRASYVFSMIAVYTVGYAAAATIFKPYNVANNEIRIAAATMISSIIGFILISKLRCREGHAARRLEYLSSIDALCGVYNRKAVQEKCISYIAESGKKGNSYAFMMMDIDNFKQFNDCYGHETGDLVLKSFAEILKSNFKKDGIVGRFGGDEFVVMTDTDKNNSNDVKEKAQKVLDDVCKIPVAGKINRVSCSIGIAFVEKKDDLKTAFEHADSAMYRAKNAGKNQFSIN